MAKRGQPSVESKYDAPTTRVIVTLTEPQKDFLADKYTKVARGVRALVEADQNGRVVEGAFVTPERMKTLIDLDQRASSHNINLSALLEAAIAEQQQNT